MTWQLQALARAAGARVFGGGADVADVAKIDVGAIGTDSRTLAKGALFVALRGDSFDGHTFVPAAVQAGARAVLVDEDGAPNLRALPVPVLVVPNTLQALGDLGAYVRAEGGARKVAAVTGSNGKTTTKELLAVVLASRGAVHKTQGNLNNLIGVPLTLFAWPQGAWAAVVEMGMNAPGEIARLTQIARPDVGVVTCVAPAHLGGPGLGSIEAIARAKAEIFAELPEGATAVLNADDAPLVAAAKKVLGKRPVLRFGRDSDCEVRLLQAVAMPEGVRVELRLDKHEIDFMLPLLGVHNAMNAAAAAAAAWALGVSPDDVATRLPNVRVPGARLKLLRSVPPGITVLDDSYNANPSSMKAAFAALSDVAETAGGARKLAVLGDMLELGPSAAQLHAEVGRAAAAAGIAHLWAVGEHASELTSAARAAGAIAHAFSDVTSLHADISGALCRGDVLLIKGSRGMRLERLVQLLQGRPEAAD